MYFENPIKGPESTWQDAGEKQENTFKNDPSLGSPEENSIDYTPQPLSSGPEEVLRQQCIRLAADLDNMRKRQRREIDRAIVQERRAILGDLLDILDNFDRALSIKGAENNQWLEGLKSTRAQLLEVLKRYGAMPFDALGQPFDPSRHEAIATAPIREFDEGTVVEVIQTGYEMEDNMLLRPAKVVVARHG